MPANGGFQLTDGDVEFLRLVFEYRFLRIENLVELTSRTYKKIHGRLHKLHEHKYLSRIARPQQPHIYATGREAVPILVEQGIASKELIGWRIRHHELKALFLDHQMRVVDLHTILAMVTNTSHFKLKEWREGKELWDKVRFQAGSMHVTLPIRPDGFFVLEDTTRPEGQNRARFFLEADRSTTNHKKFREKLLAYWHWREQDLHQKKLAIRSFRVVTTTLNEERARLLCELAQETLPPDARKYFLFVPLVGTLPEQAAQIVEQTFFCPRDMHEGTRHALMPPFTPAANGG